MPRPHESGMLTLRQDGYLFDDLCIITSLASSFLTTIFCADGEIKPMEESDACGMNLWGELPQMIAVFQALKADKAQLIQIWSMGTSGTRRSSRSSPVMLATALRHLFSPRSSAPSFRTAVHLPQPSDLGGVRSSVWTLVSLPALSYHPNRSADLTAFSVPRLALHR